MGSVGEGSFSSSYNPTDAVVFVGISLLLGIASRHFLRGTRVPYTVALLLCGIALGSLEYGTHHRLGKIGDGIRIWANIDPDLLLAVFLPALLFESSFLMEIHQIKRCMVQMLLLAGPGVLISTFFLGSVIKLIFPYDWDWKTSLLLGGLLSATDPVAVVALLKELGASKKLSTIIEGESLMNDGTAIVVYQLFFRMVTGWRFNWGAVIKFLALASLGAVGIGLAFGIASVLWLGFIFNDTVIEITLTFAISYIVYFTAQEGCDVSGVLAVMTLGMFCSAVARTAFKGDGHQSLHHFWEMVAYIANTLIFILSGVVIAEGVLSSDSVLKTHEALWGYLVLLYVFVQVSRIVVVGLLYPFLRYFGYGLDWKEATVLVWSGLRGAVALSLSLTVKASSSVSSSYISPNTGTLFVFLTGGIVFLTLTVNGSTTQFVLQILGLYKLSPIKRRILEYMKYEMSNKALEAFGALGDDDEELGPTDWPTVKKYITTLNDVEGDGKRLHPHTTTDIHNNLDPMNIIDIRLRFLNGVQAAYWGLLEEGRITQATAIILMQSVDEALDFVSEKPLCDWNGLQSNVNFPNYYKLLHSSPIPKKLVTYFTVERLEFACSISAAFLRAHRIAQQQLHDFIGDSEVSSLVITESKAEGEEARKFLEEVHASFPQVLRVVKTRQVTRSVLNHLIEYVQNLKKVGLLEEKEMAHLHDAVQTDLKKLLRNPPVVTTPKINDLISANPLLGALPTSVRNQLVGSTKETVKLRGTTLYKAGSKPNGIWLISNGVVKWTTGNKNSVHPACTHGTTLGLYEVLIGKPYICDIVTDSVVLCFFIEAESILSVLRSDNQVVEDFLWKESVLILAKLLLPEIFEKISMQDLRVLVAERSMIISKHVRGETIEVPHHFIGFLLEGSVKTSKGTDEIITSPAALFPASVDLDTRGSDTLGVKSTSFGHQSSCYKVKTRVRVIMFDIAAFEQMTRSHASLMTFPECLHAPGSAHEHPTYTHNLSAKAMQLSIYGSTMKNIWSGDSFSSIRVKPFPRVPSNGEGKTVVSVRSEGSTTTPFSLRAQRSGVMDIDSHDESGAEDELVVSIDSSSTLPFH